MHNLSTSQLFSSPLIEASGLGNTFLIIDRQHQNVQNFSEQENAYYRQLLIASGRDSLLLIGELGNSLHQKIMRILEKDGSESSMCGNGLRAISEYYYQTSGLEKISVQTKSGIVSAHRLSDQCISTDLGYYHYHGKIPLGNQEIHLADIGEPHAVVLSTHQAVDQVFAEFGDKILRNRFNLNAVTPDFSDPYLIYNRTLERGVNAETLACGTGAVCAALTYSQKILKQSDSELTVQTRSGKLMVSHKNNRVKLSGPAKIEKIY